MMQFGHVFVIDVGTMYLTVISISLLECIRLMEHSYTLPKSSHGLGSIVHKATTLLQYKTKSTHKPGKSTNIDKIQHIYDCSTVLFIYYFWGVHSMSVYTILFIYFFIMCFIYFLHPGFFLCMEQLTSRYPPDA